MFFFAPVKKKPRLTGASFVVAFFQQILVISHQP
jgi:hypothetical protein